VSNGKFLTEERVLEVLAKHHYSSKQFKEGVA
jgi:hypothetical protein